MVTEKNIALTADAPEGLGLTTPEKLDVFDDPIVGSTDIEAVLCADPRTLADFMQTVEYVRDWLSYTAVDNEANLITFVNNVIERIKNNDSDDKNYTMLVSFMDGLELMTNVIKPIIAGYMDEIRQENKAIQELREKREMEAEQKKREIKEALAIVP